MSGRGNGHAAAPSPLFARETIDKGEVPGLGHVIIREAMLADIWPYLELAGADKGQREFGVRLMAASLEIDGQALAYDDLMRLPFRKMRLLQTLLPEIMAVNAVLRDGDTAIEEAGGKNGEGIGEANAA